MTFKFMTATNAQSTHSYDTAAPGWGDKMRALGYYDGYLGFLAASQVRAANTGYVIDIGSGTAAFAQAWIATHGAGAKMTLLDPSSAMLARGHAALRAQGVEARLVQGHLGDVELGPADEVLAAHVIEHCPDPAVALQQMHDLLGPGGRLRLVVSKPHWCNAIIWLQWRHRTFRRAEIIDLVQAAGFDIDCVYAFPAGPPSRTSLGIVATRSA